MGDETLWLCNVCKEPGCMGAMGDAHCPRCQAIGCVLGVELDDMSESQRKAVAWMGACPDFEDLFDLLEDSVVPLLLDLQKALCKIVELAPESAPEGGEP